MFIGGGVGGIGRVGGSGRRAPAPGPAPLPDTSGATESVWFQSRNGDASASIAGRHLAGPVLTNVFGNRNSGNTAGGTLPGLLAIRVWHKPGNAYSAGTDSGGIGQNQVAFGTVGAASNRALRLSWAGPQNSNTFYRNKFVWQGRMNNAVEFGDIDPVTGATGSANALRGLPTAEIDSFDDRPVTIFLRMNAANLLQAFHAFADGALVAGASFDHGATAGIAATTNACTFGRGNSSSGFQVHWSGGIADFVQLNNIDATDAELTRFARGENPATIWPSLHAHYRMAGPSDLALTAGSSGYGALVATGVTSQIIAGPSLRPAWQTDRGIQLLPIGQNFIHALPPTTVRAAANRAAVKAIASEVLLPVALTGAGSTHVQARLLRMSDNSVYVPWTRISASPLAAGTHDLVLPDVVAAVDFYAEVRREDAVDGVSRNQLLQAVGVVTSPDGQSQMAHMLFDTSPDAVATTGITGMVTLAMQRGFVGGSAVVCPLGIEPFDSRGNQMGPGFAEIAAAWEAQCDGLRLMIVPLVKSGTSRPQWISNTYTPATPLHWPNSTTPSTSGVAAAVIGARRRFTNFVESWHTSDQAAFQDESIAALNDKLWLGIGASGGERHFGEFSLRYAPWVCGTTMQRHRNITSGTPDAATQGTFETARSNSRRYYRGEITASLVRDHIANQDNQALGPITDGPHNRRVGGGYRGNTMMARNIALAICRAARIVSVDIESRFTGAARSGAVITLAAALNNSGSLTPLVDAFSPINGFEVSEDGGTTWLRTGFTAAISGATVTLTRGIGSWAANTRVRYLHGYPWNIPPGNDTTAWEAETAAIDGFLCETVASAPMGRVAIRASFGDLVAA